MDHPQLRDKGRPVRGYLGNIQKEYLADGPESFRDDIKAACALKLENLAPPGPERIHKFSTDNSPGAASIVEVGDSPAALGCDKP